MSVEENKAIIQRFIEEGLNQRNADLIELTYSPHYVGFDAERPTPRKLQDLHDIFTTLLAKVLPDGKYTTQDLLGEGDRVVWHWTFNATHTGELQGMPPTGKPIEIKGVNIFHLVDGKVLEDWVYRDTLKMLRQLGALPTVEITTELNSSEPSPSTG